MLLFFYPLRIQPWSQGKRNQTRIKQTTLTAEMQTVKSRTNRAAIGAPITSDATGSLLARDVAHVVKTRRHAQNTTTLISSDVAQADSRSQRPWLDRYQSHQSLKTIPSSTTSYICCFKSSHVGATTTSNNSSMSYTLSWRFWFWR